MVPDPDTVGAEKVNDGKVTVSEVESTHAIPSMIPL
jgi:hypothetical protein